MRRPQPRAAWRPGRVLSLGARAVLLLLGLQVAAPRSALAQARADSAAVLLDAARRLEAEGQRDVAQALYRFIARQYAGTPAAAAVVALSRRLDELGDPRAGRTELMVGGTLYGAWLGVAIPLALDADRPEAYGIGLLAGAPLGFLAARAYANAHALTEGQARAITFGGAWGTWQGAGWSQVFRLGRSTEPCPWDPAQRCETGDATTETTLAMIAGGLAGIGAGVLLARRPIRAGTATAVSLGSGWGTVYGFGTAVLTGLDDDERATWALTLIGGNVGIVASALLAERMRLTRERARLISIAGVAGGLAGLGLDLLIQPRDERLAVAIPMATSALGLVLGVSWTRHHDQVRPEHDAPPPDEAAALLRIDGGSASFGVPQARIALLPTNERGKPGAAARVELLHVRLR